MKQLKLLSGCSKHSRSAWGGIRTRCILTDQDQAMAVAVAKELPGVVHKICRWHVVNKHMPQLVSLFGMYAKRHFKDKFYSVLNHPLTPVEFEAAWKELLDEFELHNDSTLESLCRQRELFIPAFFKGQYCGRMASTQRSESSNFVMKYCFVDRHTALHRFAKKMLDFVHSRRVKESEETYHATSKRITISNWQFEVQMSKIYTRNVFNDFEKKMRACTAFDIEDDPTMGENCYLVMHTNRSSKISWGQHQFKVRANKGNGDFHCECKEWEHTGLFCVHLLRAFIRIQLKRIPGHCILRRYTVHAKQELWFDRNDKLLVGDDGVTQSCRLKELRKVAMAAATSGSMSSSAHIRSLEVLKQLDNDNKLIPPDIGPRSRGGRRAAPGEEVPGSSSRNEGAHKNAKEQQSANEAMAQSSVDRNSSSERLKGKQVLAADTICVIADNGIHISREPPPRAKHKGRSIPASEKDEITLGAKGEKKGTRRCGSCGYFTTHNERTCLKQKHNRDRLEALKNRTRGKPRGAQNKQVMQHDSGGEEQVLRQSTGDKEPPTGAYINVDSDSADEEFDEMDMEV